MTEAGTQKRLAVWIVRDITEVERIATLGPDVLALDRDEFADILAGTGARIKNVLTDQRCSPGSVTPTPTRSCTPRSSLRSPPRKP